MGFRVDPLGVLASGVLVKGEKIFWVIFDTPFGKCLVAEGPHGIVAVTLPHKDEAKHLERLWEIKATEYERKETPLLQNAYRQILEYFDRKRTRFDLALDLRGTPFQVKVWKALRKIPYGRTWSYQDVARTVGNVRATRAVGMANHRNPVPIVIPCHRVIGKDGSMTGFGGGVALKKKLLDLERSASRPNPRAEALGSQPVLRQIAP